MDRNTPDAANAYPKVGPVVINEIMYTPDWPAGGMYANDGYEFIELYNITDEPVKLYRDDKALPCQFSDGIDYVFGDAPDEVTIAADDYTATTQTTGRQATLPPRRALMRYWIDISLAVIRGANDNLI